MDDNDPGNDEDDEDFGEVVGSSAYSDAAVVTASVVLVPHPPASRNDTALGADFPPVGDKSTKRPSSSDGGPQKKKRTKNRQRDEIDDIFGGL